MSFFLSSSSSSESGSAGAWPLAWLEDIPCSVEFVLGQARVSLRQCMELAPRVVVRLDQVAGADIELRVEGRVVVSGEIVIVDNMTGLRITRIVPQSGVDAEPADG